MMAVPPSQMEAKASMLPEEMDYIINQSMVLEKVVESRKVFESSENSEEHLKK